ncbi:LPXTG cell wall anchor domain-containing protein [Leifsonia aquatica]|uniref:LPXTG cell wall anchor domain-containing protein n=1 Tax=Leifsonia aquatica TaxID=144185 RepID=UPI00046815DA|nr:LPXTG cell wall anchor domain-containing protein [Leifsonia aquatica]
MFKKILAAAAVTVAVLFAAPAAANAVDYTQGSPCRFDTAVAHAGDTVHIVCDPGTWDPREFIDWTGTGEDGSSITLAAYRTTVSSIHFAKQSNADGSDLLTVTLPADAVGSYAFTGVGRTSMHTCPASITVLPADSAVTVSDPGSGLADTGSTMAVWAIWIGGGLLAAGLVTVSVVFWARKIRES